MKMRIFVIAISTIFVALSAAWADTKVTASAGDWNAFEGTTSGNKPVGVCGVSRDTNNQYFGLKLFAGEDTFTIQMGSKRWQVAEKQKIGVTMIIDQHNPWNATGSTFRFADGDMGIEYDIDKNQVGKFMAEFRGGGTIRIQFRNSGMPDWALSLDGTGKLSDTFMACTRKLK